MLHTFNWANLDSFRAPIGLDKFRNVSSLFKSTNKPILHVRLRAAYDTVYQPRSQGLSSSRRSLFGKMRDPGNEVDCVHVSC